MALVGEILERIQFLYSKGIPSQDTRLRDRHIYSVFTTKASRVLEERLNKKQKIGNFQFVPLTCVELEEVSIHECPEFAHLGCKIWKTKCKLPTPIVDREKHLIQSVTSVTGDIIFSEINWHTRVYASHDLYTAMSPKYFLKGDYLYVVNNIVEGLPMERITIFILPRDPIAALLQCDSTAQEDCEFDPLEVTYPLNGKDLDSAVQMTIDELVGIFSKVKEDKIHDNQDT